VGTQIWKKGLTLRNGLKNGIAGNSIMLFTLSRQFNRFSNLEYEEADFDK
jgi:hypothetical protein